LNVKRTFPAIALVLVVAAALTAACAKRPATTQASAPPPTAAVTPTPAPPPQALAPAAPAPAPAPPAPATPAPAPAPAAVQPPPPPAQFAENAALADIHFDFDKSAIRPADTKILEASAAWLKANPKTLVLIEGHCDERGTNEYNLALGERRAQAAQAYLVSRGIAAGRMTVISYGEERPACLEHTEACWAKNRRSHFLTKPE
jgi:peptidoglycan-associated lipoprotein